MFQVTIRGKVESLVIPDDERSPVVVSVVVKHYAGGETVTNVVTIHAPNGMSKYLSKYSGVGEYRSFTGRYLRFSFGASGEAGIVMEYLDMTF